MRSPWWAILLAAVIAAVLSSTATSVEIPERQPAAPAPAPPAPGPGGAAAPAAPATPATPVARPVVLRMGAFGARVRDLQRELRRRGQRYLRVDGAFGPNTRRAVRAVQRRMRMRPTGVANAAFLRRLGIQVSRPAAVRRNTLVQPLGARYLRAFPVVGEYTYINDWHFPRHQGVHEGNDIMAARGTPVVAVADGTIKRMRRAESGLGGITIWLLDTAGNEYYYAHLHSIAAGLREGSRVRTGQVIATVGNTGDARATAPHLHFELHPGGGEPINPYSELIAVDPARGR